MQSMRELVQHICSLFRVRIQFHQRDVPIATTSVGISSTTGALHQKLHRFGRCQPKIKQLTKTYATARRIQVLILRQIDTKRSDGSCMPTGAQSHIGQNGVFDMRLKPSDHGRIRSWRPKRSNWKNVGLNPINLPHLQWWKTVENIEKYNRQYWDPKYQQIERNKTGHPIGN